MTKNFVLIPEPKDIREFCMSPQITLMVEYLPGIKNLKVDETSREVQKSLSEWILYKGVFQKIAKLLGQVDADLYASRLSHQVPRYIGCHQDPYVWMFDVFARRGNHMPSLLLS